VTDQRSTALLTECEPEAVNTADKTGPGTTRRERPLRPVSPLDTGVVSLAAPRRPDDGASPPSGDPPPDADTKRIAADIARTLGLSLRKLDIRIDDDAARETERRGAKGLVKDGTLLLHPGHFHPHRRSGRYLLGHELTHLAQLRGFRTVPGEPVTPGSRMAEVEAHRLGLRLADGLLPERPFFELRNDSVAASQGLDDLVADRYGDELTIMRRRLRGFLNFLWVTDGDVAEVLTILQSVSFVVARSMVNALDEEEDGRHRYKRRLIREISSSHFNRFRREILAAYSVMPRQILRRQDEEIFDGMDFRGLSDEEHFAVRYVRDNGFPPAAWQRLMDPDEQGQARADAVRRLVDGEAEGALGRSRFDLTAQEREAQTRLADDITERSRAVASARGIRLTDFGSGGSLVQEIAAVLENGPTDAQRLQIIDRISRYIDRPRLFRGIVESLQPPTAEEDLLDRLLDDFPVRALYRPALPDVSREEREGSRAPGPHTRMAALLRIAALRAPWRNVELAEDLLSEAWIFNQVDEQEAYLAFQLIKVLPERIRENFLEAEGGAFADRLRGNLTQEMRESATMNFYTGGEGRIDQASIQSQLLEDAPWQPGQERRLETLIRMAIAAGEHRWVFHQSRMRYGAAGSEQRRRYTESGFIENIVEPLQLYNPEAVDASGDPAPRRRWQPEYLHAVDRGGVFDFIFQSREPWSLIGSALFGESLGGEGLNAVALQDVLGGSFLGIRFATPEEMADEELAAGARRAVEQRHGTNFIDRAHWDTDRGVLEVYAEDLVIAAVRYPIGSLMVQAGGGRVRGLDLNLVYPTREATDQTPGMRLIIRQLDLEDLMLISHDSMMGINELHLNRLRVTLGHDTVRGQRGFVERGFDARTLFPLTPILRLIGYATSEFEERGEEISTALINPPVASPLSVTLESLILAGLTTSSGRYVDAVQLGEVEAGISGTREDYLYFLRQSRRRLERRRTRMGRRLAAITDETQREEFQERLARINRSCEGVTELIENIVAAQREVRELNRVRNPGPEQRRRLARQQEFLRRFDRGGMVLDVGTVRLRGSAGREGDESDETPELAGDVHGHGASTAGLLAFLTESDAIHRILQGDDYRAPVVRSLQREEGSFVIDLGNVSLPEDFTLRSGIPTAAEATREFNRVDARLQRRPWDDTLRDERRRLLQRRRDAARYHELAAIGASHLNETEQQEMRRLRESLTSQEAFYAHRLRAEGARLEFSDSGRRIALYTEQFDALGPVDEQGRPVRGGAALRFGGLGIGGGRGRDIHAAVEVEGGLLDLSRGGLISTGDIRQNLTRGTLRGAHLEVTDIEQADREGGVLRDFNITVDPQTGVLDVRARDVTTVTRSRLQREIDRLQGIPEERRSNEESDQLSSLQTALTALEAFETEIARLQREIREAADPEQQAPLQEELTAELLAFAAWRRDLQLPAASVSDVSVRIMGLGGLVSRGFDLNEAMESGIVVEGTGPRDAPTSEATGERRTGRLFGSATVTRPDVFGIQGRRAESGAVYGRIESSQTRLAFHDIYIERLSLDGVASQTGNHRFWSHGVSTLTGILTTGELRFERNPSDPRERNLTGLHLNRLTIDNIAAQQLGYANEEMNLEAEIESGAIGGIVIDNLSVDMPSAEGEGATVRGDIRLGSFSDAVISARIGDALRRVRGRLNGDAVTIRFLQSGNRRIDIEDLDVDGGLIRTGAGTIRISARRLRGSVEVSADGNIVTFDDIRLERLDLGRFSYRSGENTISGRGPTVFRDVRIDAVLDKTDPDNWQFRLNHIFTRRITSRHLVYERGGYTITIGPAEPATARDAPAPSTAGEEPERQPLEIVNLDIRNVHWSPRQGLRAAARGTRGTIHADTFHAALNVHRNEFMDPDVVVDVDRIDAAINDRGEQVWDINTIGVEADGRMSPGIQTDASARQIVPGRIRIDTDGIHIPDLQIPVMELDRLEWTSDRFRLMVEDRGDHLLVRQLRAERLVANNAALTLRNIVDIGGERDVTLSISGSATATVTDIQVGGHGESAEGFVIPFDDSDTGPAGRIRFGEAQIRQLSTSIGEYLSMTANGRAAATEEGQPAFSFDLFSDGDFAFSLPRMNLDELEGRIGQHHIQLSREAVAEGAVPGIDITGLSRTREGEWALDEAALRGLRYTWGRLTIDVQQASLPEGFEGRGGVFEVPRLTISSASFRIDDLMQFIQDQRSDDVDDEGLQIDAWALLDSANGRVEIVLNPASGFVERTGAQVDITGGTIDLAAVWESLDYLPRQVISVTAEEDRLIVVVQSTTYTWRDLEEEQRPTPGRTGADPRQPIVTPLRTFIEYDYDRPDFETSEEEDEDDSDPPVLQIVEGNLRLSPAPEIRVGETGRLRVVGQEDDQTWDVRVTGEIGGADTRRGTLHIEVPLSRIQVVDGQPLTLGSVNLRQGRLTIMDMTADVGFMGWHPGAPEGSDAVSGTIDSAELSGAQIQFGDRETEGETSR